MCYRISGAHQGTFPLAKSEALICINKPLWILFLIINDHLQNTLCKLDRQNNSPTNKEHAHKMREKSVSTMLFVVITVVVVGVLYIVAAEVKLEAR